MFTLEPATLISPQNKAIVLGAIADALEANLGGQSEPDNGITRAHITADEKIEGIAIIDNEETTFPIAVHIKTCIGPASGATHENASISIKMETPFLTEQDEEGCSCSKPGNQTIVAMRKNWEIVETVARDLAVQAGLTYKPWKTQLSDTGDISTVSRPFENTYTTASSSFESNFTDGTVSRDFHIILNKDDAGKILAAARQLKDNLATQGSVTDSAEMIRPIGRYISTQRTRQEQQAKWAM